MPHRRPAPMSSTLPAMGLLLLAALGLGEAERLHVERLVTDFGQHGDQGCRQVL